MSNTNSIDLEAGNYQYLNITSANQTGLKFGTGDFTVSCWIKKESDGIYSGIVSNKDYGDVAGWRLTIDNSDILSVIIGDGTNRDALFQTIGTVKVSDGWIHVFLVRKAGSSIKLYKNNLEVGSVVDNSLNVNNTLDIAIGPYRPSYPTSYTFDGKIDGIGLWSRALTEEERNSVYNKGNGLLYENFSAGLKTNIEAYWDLNNSLLDKTNNNNDLTNNNSATFSTDVPFVNGVELLHVANVKIDHTKVDADLTDYPVYIDLADMPDSFWDIVSNGGGDIRVYKNDGTTQLAREVVSCDTTAKTGELHVKYTGTLSSTTDTVIQIWADGTSSEPTASSTYGSEAVWGSNYKAVYHMKNANDSTSNGNNGTVSGATSGVTGKLGDAYDFDGANDSISLPLRELYSSFTHQVWIRTDSVSLIRQYITTIQKDPPDSGYNVYVQRQGFMVSKDHIDGQYWTGAGCVTVSSSQGSISASVFKKVDFIGGNFGGKIFINGILDGSDTSAVPSTSITPTEAYLGWRADNLGDDWFNGKIDEIRILNTALSDTWISTEYNNQNSPSTFYSVCDPSLVHTANIEIQSSKVDADLTDYPVYVDLSDLPDSFWNSVSEDGGDIRVYKEDDNTQLAREIVSIDTTAKTGEMHIKYSGVLSSTANTVIHVFTNGCLSEPASDSAYGSEAVWSDYRGVWHLNENPGGTAPQVKDSTGNGYNFTTQNMDSSDLVSDGKIGTKSFSLNTVDHLIYRNGAFFSGDQDPLYYDVLIKPAVFGSDLRRGFFGEYASGYTRNFFRIATGTNETDSYLSFDQYKPSGGAAISNSPVANDNEWVKLTMVKNSNVVSFYSNAVNKGNISHTETYSSSTPTQTAMFARIVNGSLYAPSITLASIVDELRADTKIRTATWISTEYNNQNSPSTFYSVTDPTPPAINSTNFFQFF